MGDRRLGCGCGLPGCLSDVYALDGVQVEELRLSCHSRDVYHILGCHAYGKLIQVP